MDKTIYEALQAANVPMENHLSDLYCPVTPFTAELVRQYRINVTVFTSPVDGGLWYDIPFAYEPYWAARQ